MGIKQRAVMYLEGKIAEAERSVDYWDDQADACKANRTKIHCQASADRWRDRLETLQYLSRLAVDDQTG